MTRPLRLLLLAVLLSLLLPLAPRASAAPFEEVTLDNGLRVLLMPRPGSGLVASNVFVGAGSTREQDRYAGSSHFLEHLLFNGTETRTQEEIYALADRLGAYNNATTRREYTHFMMVAAEEVLAEALDLQADMLLHSVLPPEKFEKERGIVVEEIAKDSDDPGHRVSTALDSLLHAGDPPYAREVLGTVATISALPREAVLDYYHRQYVPSNMRLVLMGDFQRQEALSLIQRLFTLDREAEAPPLPSPPMRLEPDGPSTLATRGVDAPTVTARVTLVLRPENAREHARAALLAEVLGGGEQHRIQRALSLPPAVDVQGSGAQLNQIGGDLLLQMEARYAPGPDLDEVLGRLEAALASLGDLDPAEVEAARVRLTTAEISQLEQLHYYALFHGDRLWSMPEGFLTAYLDALEDVQLPELEAWSREAVSPLALHATAAGPGLEEQRGDLPATGADRTTAALRARSEETPPPLQRQRPPRLEHDQPPTAVTLANGMTVLHTATDGTRMLALHLLVEGRSAREPEDAEGLADVLHRLLPERGELARQDRMGAELKVADNPWIPYDDYYSTPLYSFVRLGCVDEFYGEAMDYLAWMCRRSFDDPGALAQVKGELGGVLARRTGSSAEAAGLRLDQLLYAGHPLSHRVLPDEEFLAELDLERIREFAPVYLDPARMVLSVVGNVPREEALDRICRAFDTTVADGDAAPAPIEDLPLTDDSVREEIEVGGQQSQLRMGRVVEVAPEDRWALQVAVMVASDRMQQDLRETRGLAYSLGIGALFLGQRAAVVARMGTQPANLEEAEAGMRTYLTSGGLEATPAEIEAAVNSHRGRMRMRRVSSMGQAFSLGRDFYLTGDLDHAAAESEGLAAVGPEDVDRAARRYLGPGPLIIVLAR